jgi:cell division protease FtsH
MIKEYGMSDRLGQVYFAREKRQQFLDIGLQETGDYSNATAEAIDEEIKTIISTEYAKALEILRSKKDILQKGAELLLEKEKIEGTELKALMESQ